MHSTSSFRFLFISAECRLNYAYRMIGPKLKMITRKSAVLFFKQAFNWSYMKLVKWVLSVSLHSCLVFQTVLIFQISEPPVLDFGSSPNFHILQLICNWNTFMWIYLSYCSCQFGCIYLVWLVDVTWDGGRAAKPCQIRFLGEAEHPCSVFILCKGLI